MKKTIMTAVTGLLLAAALPVTAFAQELIVGGLAVGIRVRTEGVLVSGTAAVETREGARSPAEEAGVLEGDRILELDGRELHGAAELIAAVGEAGGAQVELTLQRDGQELNLWVLPALSTEGRWMLGMWLRDTVTGIGTVTFCDPETGVYGALGHSITDEELGAVIPLDQGGIYEAQITGVNPGAPGVPGALNGEFGGGAKLGSVEHNSALGIYGVAERPLGCVTAEVGRVQPGPAEILATVEGREVRSFQVLVTRVFREDGREQLMFSVTDPELCSRTGGVVQGMSGSPILQEGKLVGAVTHVFLNDPTRGYGLSIQDMLEEAGLQELAA
ncbi:MAG: SpoIVB peptidase [Oscillospiraceae bacterium]|nr:SpoIVB peptidase [Oscillospiraceae bacterium]